jgi:transcriptional regulator with XRE-family HTH domain
MAESVTYPSRRKLARFRERLLAARIRQGDVAKRLGVTRELVCQVLAARITSRPVVAEIERILRREDKRNGRTTSR